MKENKMNYTLASPSPPLSGPSYAELHPVKLRSRPLWPRILEIVDPKLPRVLAQVLCMFRAVARGAPVRVLVQVKGAHRLQHGVHLPVLVGVLGLEILLGDEARI